MSAPRHRSVDLLGPDVILLAMETLAAGRAASGNAALVVELASAVDAARVATALGRFLDVCPWLGGRLRRPLPWGKLAWHVPAGGPTPPPIATTTIAPGGLTATIDRELAHVLDPRREPPLRVTLAAGGDATSVVLTWAHPLMDPHGAEHLLRLLAELDEHSGRVPPWPTPPLLAAPPDLRPLRERGALASRGAAHLRSLAPVPPRSLASAPRRRRRPRVRRERAAAPLALPFRRRSAAGGSGAPRHGVAARGRRAGDDRALRATRRRDRRAVSRAGLGRPPRPRRARSRCSATT